MDHIREFVEQVRNAPTDKWSERVVRNMLELVAKDCPMETLVRLGECLIECRKDELHDEAERN